jgi:Ca-activated chloride channel homolog
MNLRTLMLLSATGMVATGAVVWTTVDPAAARTSSPTAPIAGPTFIPPKPPPPPDHSHFQAGKTLMVEGRLGHAVLPAGVDNDTFLFVDVTGTAAIARSPAPLDLSIVIDKSGSMAGKRLTNAIAAARTAIQRLRDGDVVSVITFHSATEVVIQPTTIDQASRDKIIAKLGTIRAAGETCISCGIDTAMSLLAQRQNMVDRILLLSDGQPTVGVKDVDGFRRIAENCRRMGAGVTTIGVDVGYDEKVMSTLARNSNGNHFFVADPTGLPSIFDQEMASLTKTVASHVELTVDLAPGVFVDHVFDRAATSTGSQLVVPFGTLSAGDHKTLLARVRIPRGTAGERAIAAVRLRYDDLAETKVGNCEGQLAARLTDDASAITPLDGIVSARVSSTETAQTLEDANALFQAGRGDEARIMIARQQAKLAKDRDVATRNTPAARRPGLDATYTKNNERLDGAGSGFAQTTPTVAPGSDKNGQATVRQSEADAVEATK